jgi:hypothetical protein
MDNRLDRIAACTAERDLQVDIANVNNDTELLLAHGVHNGSF